MKIAVISLGCAKNLVDTENLLGILKASGQETTTSWKDADACIINTCGFVEDAKKEAIDTILEAADYKQKGLKKLVVMGCLSQRYKPQLEQEMPEVDRFIALDEYPQLGTILTEVLGERIVNNYGKAPRVLSDKPWMAYLRIADGCNNRCSYCAIPSIRGNFRSRTEEDILAEADGLAKNGVKELNLIAQDSSMYGIDIYKNHMLADLLKKLNAIEGLHWIRVLYLYPDEIPDDLIETMKECEKVLPYFDIPVQHGADAMLHAMHRRGSRALIEERCARIRQEIPQAVLRTTLICGFPGETEEDHKQNLSLVENVRWDHLGAFTYSREEDTPSYAMDDNVPPEIKEQRKAEVMTLQNRIASEDRLKLIGRKEEVLVEGRSPLTGLYQGRSCLYAPDGVDGCVYFRSQREIPAGTFVMVEYTKASGQNMIGREITDAE